MCIFFYFRYSYYLMIFRHGCHRLTLEKSTLSFSTLKDIMEMLQSVVHGEYKIESVNWLTEEQLDELDKLKRKFHAEVTWSS